MKEDPESTDKPHSQKRTWLEKLQSMFSAGPQSRDELLEIIKDAADNKLLDQEALEIIEGAMDVSTLQAREIMVPRMQIIAVKLDDKPQDFLPKIIESGHSRFPVIGDSVDDIKGILLAKDLLKMMLEGTTDFSLEPIIRTANIIPESKRVNILLREFREKRYHMALVIDEYGGISGLITIEDILEEIVGEIEDETDEESCDDMIKRVSDTDFIIKALTPIEDFNEKFKAKLNHDEFDTIGGIIMQSFGHLPKRNEVTKVAGFTFRILYADNRRIHLVRLTLEQS